MVTFATQFPGSAAALSDRDVVAQTYWVGQSSTVIGGSRGSSNREFAVELPGGRRLVLTIPFELDPMPAWISPTVNACVRILELPANWDSYGGKRIRAELVAGALLILIRSMPIDLTAPSVVPLGDGGVQLEWHRRQQDLEITFSADESPQYYYRNRITDEELEGSPSSSSEFAQLLRNLT